MTANIEGKHRRALHSHMYRATSKN